jgi:hypothetical protein
MMLDLVAVVALLEWTARIVGVNPTRTRPAALIGGLLAMPVWMILAITAVHLDDVMVLTCVAASLPMVARGRWLPAGALLGTAVATKPWAVVVVPLVFALPRRVMPRAVLVTVAVSALWWVPFLIADPSTPWALSGFPVPVTPDSTYGLLGYHGHSAGVCAPLYGCMSAAPSWLRPLQFGAGFGFALLAVRRGRWLAAPLVGLATRVLLDSQAWGYYFVGPVIAALAWDIAQGRRIPRWAIVVAAAEYAGFVIHGNATQAAIRLVMCAVVIYWFAVRRSTPRHQQAVTPTDASAAQLAPAPA